jgi:hypothetical protein
VRRLPFAAAALLLLAGGAQARPSVPSFKHVFVFVFENKESDSVIGGQQAPTFSAMAARYATLTRYYGVTHPSLPNYLALVSGSTFGVHDDCTSCQFAARNLADSLEAAKKTWKAYAEGLPRRGFMGVAFGGYAKKHMPFLYFRNIATRRARRENVVPLGQLTADLRAHRLPDFALVVPNLCNSMHDCSVATGDAWLRRRLPPLLSQPNTVVFVIFDEGRSAVRGGGHIPAFAAGTAVKPGSHFGRVTNHYGLLRTVEEAWGLPLLGRSAVATPITGIWRSY